MGIFIVNIKEMAPFILIRDGKGEDDSSLGESLELINGVLVHRGVSSH
jgi:hypothetical protein